jgi:FdhD protein
MRAPERPLPEEVAVALVFDGAALAVLMASPTDLRDLAMGFALTEGVITSPAQVTELEVVAQEGGYEARVWLSEDRAQAMAARRRALAGPVGCGLCGIESLAQANRALPVLPASGPVLSRRDLLGAVAGLRARQPLHDRTRAAHAAGFLRPALGIVEGREDVGRHNALDKLVGAWVHAGARLGAGALVVTSRLSVDLVQKAVMAGCPVLAGMSAPTAQAVAAADAAGLTLIGHLRADGYQIFTHPHRIQPEVPDAA